MPRVALATPDDDYRDRQADLMRAKRDSARIVVIPRLTPAQLARRKELESDDVAWLMYFFAIESGTEAPFTYEFTGQQRDMIAAIRGAIVEGDDQALAASRGEGKTTLFERMLIKYHLEGRIRFSVLFSATGSAADNSLDSIKTELEVNDRLHEFYPEVCVPVRALENTPNRAHYQKVSGFRFDNGKPFEAANSKFSWCGQEVILPKVPGSPSSGGIIATRGLDSAVRGLKKKGRRPDVAGIDDPDTEDTARSEEQAKKLRDRINRGIAGLGSQKRRVARVMLTTLQSRISASYTFTNPDAEPSFKGRRFRFLVKPPDNPDLWDEYVQLRRADLATGSTAAFEFYVANREAMDAGAVVANENRYTQGELSALQFYFNEVARIGAEAVATEYDNDPPEEAGPVESGITSYRVQKQVSGYGRGVIPPGCVKLTRGVDCKKTGLHWVVRAWMPDATGYTIDYGFHDTHGTIYGVEDKSVDIAIRRAILELLERPTEYKTVDGEVVPIDLTLIDARYRTDAVYAACIESGLGVYPVMGFGKSAGCVRATFTPYQRQTATERPGDGWNLKRDGKIWVVQAHADHWKAWEHDRWMTEPEKPGCMYLFGEATNEKLSFDQKSHHAYSRHITAEVEVEEMVKGVLKRGWKPKPGHGQNHYLDASYYSDVAASILGIRLKMAQAAKPTQRLPGIKSAATKTLAQYAAEAQGRR